MQNLDSEQHISNQQGLSFLRLENYCDSWPESVLIGQIADLFGDGVIVIPQAYYMNMVVNQDTMFDNLGDVSSRFEEMRTLPSNHGFSWERFREISAPYNSTDILICLRDAGEIVPILAIEVDGARGEINSNGQYEGGTRDDRSRWNMRNKLEVMRCIGLECIVIPTPLVFEPASSGANSPWNKKRKSYSTNYCLCFTITH